MSINTNNYPAHKTISLVEEKTIVNAVVESSIIDSTQRTAVPPVIKPLVDSKLDSKPITTNSYPSHKTIVLSAETVALVKNELKKEVVEPINGFQNKELNNIKSTAPVPEIRSDVDSLVSENQDITVGSVKKKVEEIGTKENYPAHKTVSLASTLVTEQKTEVKTPEPLVTKPNVTEDVKTPVSKPVEPIVNITTDTNFKNAYPAHKTFSFIADVSSKVSDNQNVNLLAQAVPTTESKSNTLAQVADNKVVAPKEKAAPTTKAKKPLVWIIASATILVTSAATVWYVNHEKNKLQEEVVALKQSNVELSENLLKLQKDIRIDDIIARAGTVDAKNNIAVEENATKSDVIRTCFSLIPNANAKQGKKTVYLRLLDGAGNVVTANKNNTFDYRGEKIEYSEKKEIDFKGAELMLCVDCKTTQKLEKGAYKAELYSDGVLDGTSSFELK